jgi:hypothetical protein
LDIRKFNIINHYWHIKRKYVCSLGLRKWDRTVTLWTGLNCLEAAASIGLLIRRFCNKTFSDSLYDYQLFNRSIHSIEYNGIKQKSATKKTTGGWRSRIDQNKRTGDLYDSLHCETESNSTGIKSKVMRTIIRGPSRWCND